jgi:hypothetical protein
MPPLKVDEAHIRAFPDQKSLEAWYRKNHDKADELWLKLARKGSGLKSVTHAFLDDRFVLSALVGKPCSHMAVGKSGVGRAVYRAFIYGLLFHRARDCMGRSPTWRGFGCVQELEQSCHHAVRTPDRHEVIAAGENRQL